MKIKKAIAAAVAAVMTLSGGAVALSGCNSCDHVYKMRVIEAATCMSEGSAEYKCGICGDSYTEVLPVDPDAHNYGEWNVVKQPDSQATGTAVKICSLNESHFVKVDLPVLPEDDGKGGYDDVRVTKAPTALKEGVLSYILSHEKGDVAVDVPIPAKGVETVADGVEAALESKSKVRNCTGEWGFERQGTQWADEETPYRANKFSYEFGENYTHIKDTANDVERWLSVGADGQLWAFRSENGGSPVKETEEGYLQGQLIPLSYTALSTVFGAEELLGDLYQKAQIAREADEKAGIDPKDNFFSETYSRLGYDFTFAVETSKSTVMIPALARISVHFELSEEYTLKSLTVTSSILLSLNNPDGTSYINWEKDENGKFTILNENGDKIIDRISLTQNTKTQVPQEPQNPYAQEQVFFSEFDILNSTGVVVGENTVTVTADANNEYSIANIAPATANVTFDPVQVYLVRSGEEILLGYNTLSSKGVNGYVSGKKLYIRSHIAGEITLKVATKNVTKYLHLNVMPNAPSRLYPWVYNYGDNGYMWEQHVSDTEIKKVTLYVGQSLCFKAAPAQEELNYVETGYTPYIYSGDATKVTLDNAQVLGETVSRFTASAAGTYRIRCATTYKGSMVGCVIDVEVLNVPDMSTCLAGEYSARMTYPKPGNVSVNIEVTGANTAVATIVNMNGDTETLGITFSGTQTSATVTSQHSGGANLGYSVSLNEAYKLVLSRPTGYGGNVETVVLNVLE